MYLIIKYNMEKTQKVLDILKIATKPLSIQQLEESTGLDAHEVDKAIKKLKEEGKVESPQHSYWSLIK